MSLHDFHGRPARILGANRFAEAALARVTDPRLQDLSLIGSIDQSVDNVELLTSPAMCRELMVLWNGTSAS